MTYGICVALLFQHLCADELCRLCHMGRKQFPSMPISSSPLAWLCFACPIFAGSTQSGKGQSRWDLLSEVTQSIFLQVNLIFPTIYIICSILVTLVPMMASPKETGERVNSTNPKYSNSSTGIGCAIIASGIPVYFILVSEYPLKKPVSLRQFLGQNLHSGKISICFPPSQHNNRVAEAVCGGDASEKIGLKFNEHCTTWSRCTRWQIILTCPVLEFTSQFQARIQFLRRGMKIFPAFKVAFQQTLHQNRLISN